MIREATSADIPFLLEVAHKKYNQPFDVCAVRDFLTRILADESSIIFRTNLGAAVISITRAVWGGPPRAYVLFIAAMPDKGLVGDGLRLLRAADAWRKTQGAKSLHFGEETGERFAVLAKRLGAKIDRPSFVIEGGEIAAEKPAPESLGRGSTLLDRILLSPNLVSGRPPLRLVEMR